MTMNLEGGGRGLALGLVVLSLVIAPAGVSAWSGGETTDLESSPSPIDVAGDRPTADRGIGPDEPPETATHDTVDCDRIAEPVAIDDGDSDDFGDVRVGSNATRRFVIENDGTGPTTVTGVTIEGEDAEAFRIVTGNETTTIEPGDSHRIALAFAPESQGDHRASLRVERAEESDVTVDLTGTGTAPDVELEPETIRFANVTDERVAENLTITNNGTAPLTVEEVRILGPDSDAFGTSFDGPITIDPNESRSVSMTFEQADPVPRFATVHVMSSDPDQPQRNVWLTNTETVVEVDPSMVLEDRTIVNASVENAEANASQSINVSWPLTRDDAVAIDSLAVTPERSRDFDLSITKSTERLEGVPRFELGDGTERAAFLTMDSTLPNEDLRDVTVTFRVRKDQFTENRSDPSGVALYTHQGSRWIELPTRLVDESRTHYFFESRSPGLVDFATGIKQAKFRIDDAVVSVTEIRTGESVDVSVRVTNVGGADGTYTVRLIRDESEVDRRELSIAPDGSRQTLFTHSFDEPGTYELYVNDHFVGTITVD